MKKSLIFIFTIFLLASCEKDDQTGDPQPDELQPNYSTFSGKIGTNDNSSLFSNDNNLLICGNMNGNVSILKISKTGEQIWRNDFDAGQLSRASGIAELNSNIYICGETYRNSSISGRDVLLIKTDALGDTIWTKTYGGTDADYGTNIIATSDGNLLISGKTESFGAGLFGDIYLSKVNADGDELWSLSYPDQDQEEPFHLMETQNGEYLVTGTNEDNSQDREIYLLKVSESGQQIWNKKIGPADWKWGLSTIELANGDLMICGKNTQNGHNQVLVVKTDNMGEVIWEKEYGEDILSEEGNSIKENADGSFTITGTSFDVSTGTTDIILLKIDQDGNEIWFKKFGSELDDSGVNLLKDSNDDNIITGNFNGGIFMTKADNNGVFK